MEIHTGIYTTSQLKADGASDREIRNRIHADDLTHERPGWYSTPGADPAVRSAVRGGGVATCLTALDFHKRAGLSIWLPRIDRVHIRLSKRGLHEKVARPKWLKVCQCYGRPLPTDSALDTIPRALNSAARCLAKDEWIALCDSILHNTEWTIPDLQAQMQTIPRSLRDLMARCDVRSESGPESLARIRLEDAGYTVNVQPVLSRRNHRGDLRIGRLLIECDSKYHNGEARERDTRRDRKTLRGGWLTVRISAKEIMYNWPEVEDDIAALVERRTWRLQQPPPELLDRL